jgi:hypothetical protein
MTWEDEIGNPAERAKEGERSLIDTPTAYVVYEMAPLDKGSAVRVECGYRCGDRHRCWIPWHRFGSRDKCLDFVLEQAQIHFGYPVVGPEQREAQEAILQIIAGMDGITAADFEHDPPIKSHVARIKRGKSSQGLLF